MSTITRTLKVLEETLGKHEDEIMMLEAIVICLTRMVPLLNEVCVWGGGYVWGVYVWVWGVWVWGVWVWGGVGVGGCGCGCACACEGD